MHHLSPGAGLTGPTFLSGDINLYKQNEGFVVGEIPNANWTLEVSLKAVLEVRKI